MIDDAQRLDAGTAAALGQAMSRITHGVAVLAASRPGGRPVDEWPGKSDFDRLLEPLSEAEIFGVVRRHRPTVPDPGGNFGH